jgi:hypothetical protein
MLFKNPPCGRFVNISQVKNEQIIFLRIEKLNCRGLNPGPNNQAMC